MNTAKPSAWLTAESGSSPGATHDSGGITSATVLLQLRLVDRRWHIEVERDGRRMQLDGLTALSSYLDQLAHEAPAARVRGLR